MRGAVAPGAGRRVGICRAAARSRTWVVWLLTREERDVVCERLRDVAHCSRAPERLMRCVQASLVLRLSAAPRRAPRPTLRVRCASGGDDARAKLQRAFDAPSTMPSDKNVLGQPLALCCADPKTGFFRDGYCCTGPQVFGKHIVCAKVSEAFLAFSRSRGNDLVTPRPEYSFPGLKPGNRWCLCVSRWKEAMEAGCAPPVVLSACAEGALKYVTLEQLQQHALPE